MTFEDLKHWYNEFRANKLRAFFLLCLAFIIMVIIVYATSYVTEKAKLHAVPEISKNEIISKKDDSGEIKAVETPSSLHDYFSVDFSNYLAVNRQIGMSIPIQDTGQEKNKNYELDFRLHCDFESLTKFVSVFIPSSTFPNTVNVCKVIAINSNDIVKNIPEGMIVTGSRYDDRMTEIKKLKFSGRVYIYHNAYLSSDEVDELRFFFKQNNLDPVFRGANYLIKRN